MTSEQFKVEKFSDVGTGNPFVARIGPGLIQILEATSFKNRNEINDAIFTVLFDVLVPAFISLREIRKIESGEVEKIIINLNKHYFNLFNHLWVAYKDRMPKVTELLGFDIGFLFQNEKNFNEGVEKFLSSKGDLPGIDVNFTDMLGDERRTWQNILGEIRNNYLEHKKVEDKEVQKHFNLETAEAVFNNCWQAIEDILVILLRTGLPLYAGIDIVEIPLEKRDPSIPKRFQFISTKPIP